MTDPLAGSAWSRPETVRGFVASAPNADRNSSIGAARAEAATDRKATNTMRNMGDLGRKMRG